MATVRRWTGREAKALRLAMRMSVRGFAEHLGLNPAAVSNWEKRGAAIHMRYETQQILDIDLAQSANDIRERFEQGLADADRLPPVPPGIGPSHRHSGEGPTVAAVPGSDLGSHSSTRTAAILNTLHREHQTRIRYTPPVDVANLLGSFVHSPSRVLLVKGPPGCGKTTLMHHLAAQTTALDVQLFSANSWIDHEPDLAREILRYASSPAGEDALLTLEHECGNLTRPLVVIIDSPRTRTVVEQVCQQLDTVLRQVLTNRLRFVLVLRTPPDMELSPYPVLSATLMPAADDTPGATLRLDRWDTVAARDAWNGSRRDDEPSFDALPPRIRTLARLPLYMNLIKAAGSADPLGLASPYRLVDYCVRSIIQTAGLDVEKSLRELIALAHYELSRTLPAPLRQLQDDNPGRPDVSPDLAAVTILLRTGSQHPTFDHDVIREYLFATWMAQTIEARGRSSATIDVLNDLAERSSSSADLHGVFEFLIQCLDTTAPDLLAAVAQSPTIGIADTLPLMLDLAGDNASFTSSDVLRVCASRCSHEDGLALAKALLRNDAATAALGSEYPRWMLRMLRRFGSAIWPEIAQCVDTHLPADTVDEFVGLTQVETAQDAVFLARHFFAFFGAAAEHAEKLSELLNHPDWRVRAALADGLRGHGAAEHRLLDTIAGPLAGDRDYKVRAAAAAAVGYSPGPARRHHVTTLLADQNWHVRERLLETMSLSGIPPQDIAVLVADEEANWRHGPDSLRVAAQRLLLKADRPVYPDTDSHQRALFGLLREVRAGTTRFGPGTLTRLVNDGLATADWLVVREAKAVLDQTRTRSPDIRTAKESFRQLRDRRTVQIALDTRDIRHAISVAKAAAAAGVQFIEVGDPLIKSIGVGAIGAIKREAPEAAVVAEMMSADWGRDQVVLAAESGADVVLLIGPASTASVSAAVGASRRLAVPLMIDVPEGRLAQNWVRDMERAGIDGFAITTNIDLGVAGVHPLDQAQLLRSWTKLPIAVSGGFEPTDDEARASPSWDILVVGRGVTDALNPETAARDLMESVRARRERPR